MNTNSVRNHDYLSLPIPIAIGFHLNVDLLLTDSSLPIDICKSLYSRALGEITVIYAVTLQCTQK